MEDIETPPEDGSDSGVNALPDLANESVRSEVTLKLQEKVNAENAVANKIKSDEIKGLNETLKQEFFRVDCENIEEKIQKVLVRETFVDALKTSDKTELLETIDVFVGELSLSTDNNDGIVNKTNRSVTFSESSIENFNADLDNIPFVDDHENVLEIDAEQNNENIPKIIEESVIKKPLKGILKKASSSSESENFTSKLTPEDLQVKKKFIVEKSEIKVESIIIQDIPVAIIDDEHQKLENSESVLQENINDLLCDENKDEIELRAEETSPKIELKSPSVGVSRLAESQSKIAKLQQNLPFKSTSDSIKIKSSSFGYQKLPSKVSIPKPTSKIPIQRKENSSNDSITTNKLNFFETRQIFQNKEDAIVKNKIEKKFDSKKTNESPILKVKNSNFKSDLNSNDLENSRIIEENLKNQDLQNLDLNSNNLIGIETHKEAKILTDEIPERDDTLTKSPSSDQCESEEVEEQIEELELKPPDAYADLIKEFTMADEKPKPTKKRSNSFRKIFPAGLFGQKSKSSDPKGNGKTKHKNSIDSVDFIQNETTYFNRNLAERHTFNINYANKGFDSATSRSDFIRNPNRHCNENCCNSLQSGTSSFSSNYSGNFYGHTDDYSVPVDARANINKTFDNDRTPEMVTSTPTNFSPEDYVCMDSKECSKTTKPDLPKRDYINMNAVVNKFIDTSTSSSSSTLQSDSITYSCDRSTDSPDVKNLHLNRNNDSRQSNSSSSQSQYASQNRFEKRLYLDNADNANEYNPWRQNEDIISPPELYRAAKDFDHKSDHQLIKPKALIPISTERPLPNPYHTKLHLSPSETAIFEPMYGNMNKNEYDEKIPNKPSIQNDNSTVIYEKKIQNDTAKNSPYQPQTVARNLNSSYSKSSDFSIKEQKIINNIKNPPRQIEYSQSQPPSNSGDPEGLYGTVYGDPVPVTAQVKITKPPIMAPKKSTSNDKLRARSLSPEQRYKMDIKSIPKSTVKPSIEENKNVVKHNESPKLSNILRSERSSKKSSKQIAESSHQSLEIELDYPENNFNETPNPLLKMEESDDPIEQRKVEKSSVKDSPQPVTMVNKATAMSPMTEKEPKLSSHGSLESRIPTSRSLDKISSNIPRMKPKSPDQQPFTPQQVQQLQQLHLTSKQQPQVRQRQQPQVNQTPSRHSPLIIDVNSIKTQHSRSSSQTSNQISPHQSKEAIYWSQRQKELAFQNSLGPRFSPNINKMTEQQILTHREPQTPQGSPRRPTPSQISPQISKPSLSPQKLRNLQNVEAFYWQKIREMKEEEMFKQQQMLLYSQLGGQSVVLRPQDDTEAMRRMRSRSLSPAFVRNGRRSLSLPRGINYKPPVELQNPNIPRSMPYPEQQYYVQMPTSNEYGYIKQIPANLPQNFIRGTPQRSTIGSCNYHPNIPQRNVSMQRQSASPNGNFIVNDVIYENYVPGVQLRHQAQAVHKNDNGYAPIFKRGSLLSNSSNSPQELASQQSKKVSFSGGPVTPVNNPIWPTKNGFVQSPPTRRNRSESVGSDNVFTPGTPSQSKQFFDTPTNAIKEPVYGRTKQITVSNKVCDIYGQIHDVNPQQTYGQIQKSGVIYGELKRNPQTGSPVVMRNAKVASDQSLTKPAKHGDKRNGQFFRDDPRVIDEMTLNGEQKVSEAPNRPLPPIPRDTKPGQIPRSSSYHYATVDKQKRVLSNPVSESESGSEAGEVQRILQTSQVTVHSPPDATREISNEKKENEEEWNADGKSGRGPSGRGLGGSADGDVRSSRSRSARREDPRRHTLSGDQHLYGPGGPQGGILARTMDLEGSLPRGYPPPSSAMLFDDDPGIMSEVETSSTGFRRGGKQRSSLPVVRTPSKTLERPLGLVFLQYRNETKRALLPNEITSIDTVKALFVRSFPKQLTMEYLDSPLVKIYIHDSSKDMFYELEDLRSHLRDIRDRSVLRLFESADVTGGLPGAGQGIAGGVGHFEDQSYFSEPEFDSEYQHQHIHKSKSSAKAAPYYMNSVGTLPRGGSLLRTYSPAVGAPVPADRLKALPGQSGANGSAPPKPVRTFTSGVSLPPRSSDRFAPPLPGEQQCHRPNNNPLYYISDGYMSSPERGSRGQYEDPYYTQFAPRSGSITPVIDEEASDTELLDESYSLYGAKLPPAGPRAVPAPRSQFPAPAAVPYDATRIRVEHMERQLANLTGLVQKALTQAPAARDFLQVPPGSRDSFRSGDDFDKNSSSSSTSLPDESYLRSDTKAPKLGKSSCHKSVSFEKSVSFSDEPPDMNSPKQHSPQHAADTKPPKPAIKSSTLPRTSSQERDNRLKPAPPPKPAAVLAAVQYDNNRVLYRDLQLTPEMYNQLRGLQKKAKDLRAEVRNLRRMSQAQAHSVRETIRDTFIKIRTMLVVGGEHAWLADMDQEKVRLSREEDLYKQEMLRLEKDLCELESTVEELRGNVINRKTRVNMSDVENMALILSKSSKTVADLKVRFPGLQEGLKGLLTSEMEKVVREEKFLKEEPERLESALRRCKKLTGTLVTLKRLASVQEQRLPCASSASSDGRMSPTTDETPPVTPTSAQHGKPPTVPNTRPAVGPGGLGGDSIDSESGQRPENALDALLDELQTFSRPHAVANAASQQQVPPAHPPNMAEIGRKGSMDSHVLTVSTGTGSLRRLHSYPSGSDTDNSPPIQPAPRSTGVGVKPPLPERNAELLQALAGRRVPPPPPPRTSSRSPLASPTSPGIPPRGPSTLQHIQNVQNMVQPQQNQTPAQPQSQFEAARENLGLGTLKRNVPGRSSLKERSQTLPRNIGSNLQVHTHNLTDTELQNMMLSASNSSSCESVNSQEGAKKGNRQEQLELRHQELLKKQKALQEQYARLQQIQRGNNALTVVPPTPDLLLKKTGSESNLLQKMGLNMSAASTQFTGSLTNLPNNPANGNAINLIKSEPSGVPATNTTSASTTPASTTSKVYETDIL